MEDGDIAGAQDDARGNVRHASVAARERKGWGWGWGIGHPLGALPIEGEPRGAWATGDAVKSIWMLATVLTATMAFAGCKYRKEEPVPGPRAVRVRPAATQPDSAQNPQEPQTGSLGISPSAASMASAASVTSVTAGTSQTAPARATALAPKPWRPA
jgi:hypothetical protein